MKQNAVANCAALASILYITLTANICYLIENLRLCSLAAAGKCSYILNKNEQHVLIKLFL